MSKLKPTHAAESLQRNLEELKRRAELESLRPFCEEYVCFNPGANPKTAPVTMEELKKLARAWKLHGRSTILQILTWSLALFFLCRFHYLTKHLSLHLPSHLIERRNFWKMHTELTSMVHVLLQHIEDTGKTLIKNGASSHENRSSLYPNPPATSKPSRSAKFSDKKGLDNVYGLQYFNREVPPSELAIHSRFVNFPEKTNFMEKALDIEESVGGDVGKQWTDSRKSRIKAELATYSRLNHNISKESHEAKLLKHRNLAEHLLNYSLNCQDELYQIKQSSLNTFLSVSESEDLATASYGLIAISNICCRENVRNMMVDMNVFHKLANIIPHINGPTATYASALLYYYFSCDHETEDRVFNMCAQQFGHNGMSKNRSTQTVTLYTLANLLPSVERLRITEILSKLMNAYLHEEEEGSNNGNRRNEEYRILMNEVYLPTLLSVCSFTNTHATLVNNDILDFMTTAAVVAKEEGFNDNALLISKIFLSLMSTTDGHLAHSITTDGNFYTLLQNLWEVKDVDVLRYTMRTVTILSSHKDLNDVMCDGDIIALVSKLVMSWETLPEDTEEDIAKYFFNISQPISKEYIRRLHVQDNIPLPILQLMTKCPDNRAAQQCLCRSLQNLLGHGDNAKDLCNTVLPTCLSMIELRSDVAAACTIHNLGCVPDCLVSILEARTHFKMLEYYQRDADPAIRDIYLSVIIQVCKVDQCVQELHQESIIDILDKTIKGEADQALWPNTIRLVLYIVNCKIELTESDMQSILSVLTTIVQENTPLDIIAKASVVLAHLSLNLEEISPVDPLLRKMLLLSHDEVVRESISIVLYNLSCSDHGANLLLSDGVYINIMINLMRKGAPEVKAIVGECMRTLCAFPRCVELCTIEPEDKNQSMPLADLIVIALLGTSLDSTKVVCCQAFYNCLKHESFRAELLEGRLWWAVTRISRTENQDILKAAARTLLHLSQSSQDCHSLREHHVIGYLADIIPQGNSTFIDTVCRGLKNLVREFSAGPAYAFHELSSIMKLAFDVLDLSKNVDTLRIVFTCLLCVSHERSSQLLNDMLNTYDVVKLFNNSLDVWSVDLDSSGNAMHFLWTVTAAEMITKKIPVDFLNEITSVAYGKHSGNEKLCENILGTFVNYIENGHCTPSELINMDVLSSLIYDAFGEGSGAGGYSFTSRCYAMTILAYIIEHWQEPSQITRNLVTSIVTYEMMSEPSSKDNTMRFVYVLSKSEDFAQFLLDANIMSILYKINEENKKWRDQSLMQYSTCIVRHLALQPDLVPRMLTSVQDIDTLVREIVKKTTGDICLLDNILFLFHAQAYKLTKDDIVSSRYALDTVYAIINALTGGETDEIITKIGKYIVGEILEHYSAGIDISPDFVQDMFIEMTAGNRDEIMGYIAEYRHRDIFMEVRSSPKEMPAKLTLTAQFTESETVEDLWTAYMFRDKKHMETPMLDKSQAVPIFHEDTEIAQPYYQESWGKVVKPYELVRMPQQEEFTETEEETNIYENSNL